MKKVEAGGAFATALCQRCLPDEGDTFVFSVGHWGGLELGGLAVGRDQQGEFSFLQNRRVVELVATDYLLKAL
ncbi:MAG: hypothetical protein IPM82_31390 [Saprospiraceae bacterium]|nr:hypothetical protein [Saprospiraceae bacterium]